MNEATGTRLGISALEARLGVSRRTIARWVAAGTFPRQHYLCRDRKWWLHDVEAWEAQHVHETLTEVA